MESDEPILTPELIDLIKAVGYNFCTSGYDAVLLDEARRSAERAKDAGKSDQHNAEWGATASAVLCATAACEARVSEYLAHWEFASGELTPELEAIRRSWDAKEQWRLLLRDRAPSYLPGASQEYLCLGCLIRLRDLVAHRNARLRPIGMVPSQILDCVRQGIIPVLESGGSDWPSIVLVSPVAAWAVNTAEKWLKVADMLVPLHC